MDKRSRNTASFYVWALLLFSCIRITPMNKLGKNTLRSEQREHLLVPVLGFCAVLVSLITFLIVLYLITIVIRFLFVFG